MGVKLHQHTQLEGAPACKPVSIEAAKKWSCRNDRNDTWLMGSSWLMDADLRSNLMEGFTSFLFKSWLYNQLCGQGCNHQNFINLPSTPWIRNPDLPVISQCIEHHNCWNTANIWVNHQWRVFQSYVKARKDISLFWGASSVRLQIWAEPSRARWAPPTSTQKLSRNADGRMGTGPYSAGAGHEIHGFYNGLPSGCYIPDIPGMLEILMLWKMDEHGLFLELVLDSQGNCGDV